MSQWHQVAADQPQPPCPHCQRHLAITTAPGVRVWTRLMREGEPRIARPPEITAMPGEAGARVAVRVYHTLRCGRNRHGGCGAFIELFETWVGHVATLALKEAA